MQPRYMVGVDVIVPSKPTTEGNRYILVFVDYFTKVAIAEPMRDISAMTFSMKFVTKVVCEHGAPLILLSDQGTNFGSGIASSGSSHGHYKHFWNPLPPYDRRSSRKYEQDHCRRPKASREAVSRRLGRQAAVGFGCVP